MDKQLLLIDGNSLVYRAYYGMANSKIGTLKNSQGIPVSSILVFAKMINSFITKYHPTHLLVAFDAGKKTNRHDEYPEYKANRPPMPKELRVQLPLIKEMLDHMKIKHLEIPGIEADDIIGTLAKQSKSGANVFVMSSDKDLFQLVDDKIAVIYPQPGAKPDIIYDEMSFESKVGYKPSQVIDIKGLAGDPSDNLPGVKGIGIKGAISLIKKHKSLEKVYVNIDQISGATKQKLTANETNARMSKSLATIATALSLNVALDDMQWVSKHINEELIMFFERVETKSLIKIFKRLVSQNKISQRIIF